MYTFYSGFFPVALCSKFVCFLLFPIKYQRNDKKNVHKKKKKNLITDRLVFPPLQKSKISFAALATETILFFPQCWWLCICICIAMSHVQSRFVSVNGFRLMELDRFLYCMGDRVSKKVFSVHITILVCLLTLDDNFSLFDDFTDSRGFVSLFKIYL